MPEPVEVTATGVRLAGSRWWPPNGSPSGTLLFLHGGGQTRHSWRHTATRFAERGWRTVAMDTRGHGDSEWAPDGDYTMNAMVADLRATVRSLDEPPVLIGASLGGMTSMLLEGEEPGHARALVLVDIVPRVEPEGVARIQAFMTARPEGFPSLEEVAEAVQAYTPQRTRSVNVQGLRKNLRRGGNGRWYWHWDPAFVAEGDEPRRDVIHGDRLVHAAAAITVPTLLMHGRDSDVVSDAGINELVSLLPHVEIADVSGAGHMVAGDDNDIFTERLADFLETRVTTSVSERPRGLRS